MDLNIKIMSKKEEATSKAKAKLASKVLRNPKSTPLNKSLAGELLRNAPNKKKPTRK